MKTVSNAYKTDIEKQLRNRSYVRVRFENINAAAAADGTWTPNNAAAWSEVDTLNYQYDYGAPMATLERNRWLLNGAFEILPDDYDVDDGYASSNISTYDDGSFSSSTPTLTRTFSTQRNLLGVSITFDSRVGEYPLEFRLRLFNGNTVLFNQTIRPTGYECDVETYTENVTKVEITITKTLMQHRARVEKVAYGIVKTFTNEEITSTSQSHDVDPLTRRLPSEKMSFSIIDFDHEYDPENPEGVYEFIDIDAPVSISHGYELDGGLIEWLKADQYKLDSKPKVRNHIATFSATGLLGSMTRKYYKDTAAGSKTFYDMAEAVLQDAGLAQTPSGDDPWVIDESLQDMTTYAVLPITTHANALQMIAHACCCRLFTDDDNIIHIEPFDLSGLPDAGIYDLTFDSIANDGPTLTKVEPLKEVTVKRYTYLTAEDSTVLYTCDTDATSVHIELPMPAANISVAVSGGNAATSVNIYGRAVDLTLNGSGTKTVTLTGRAITAQSVVLTYPVASDGETDAEDNPLITSDAMANALADWAAAYLSLRNTYDVSYRGNPELETGDVIDMETHYSDAMRTLILTNSIKFTGALSGTLKTKALS